MWVKRLCWRNIFQLWNKLKYLNTLNAKYSLNVFSLILMFLIKTFPKSCVLLHLTVRYLSVFRSFCTPWVKVKAWKLWPGNGKNKMRHTLRYLWKQTFLSVKSYFQLLNFMFFFIIYLFFIFLPRKTNLYIKIVYSPTDFFLRPGESQDLSFLEYYSQCEIKLGAILHRMTSVVEIHWKNAFHVAF